MKHVVTDGVHYLSKDSNNKYTVTGDRLKALGFKNLTTAGNVLGSLPKNIRKYNMQPTRLTDTTFKEVKKEFDIRRELENIQQFTEYINERKEYLNNLIYQEEMKIVDIEHAAEFYKLDAAKGYKLYKMLRDARISRRTYKNELEEIDALGRQGFNMTKTQQMIDDIKRLENKRYNPRVLEELFN